MLERYAVDFIARRFGDRWDLHAIEANLRQGGTTHLYMALRAITTGHLDPDSCLFLSPTGQPLHYVASDNIVDPRLRGLLPVDLVEIVDEAGLHYDPGRPGAEFGSSRARAKGAGRPWAGPAAVASQPS